MWWSGVTAPLILSLSTSCSWGGGEFQALAVLTPRESPRWILNWELNFSVCNLVTVLTELYRLLVFESRNVGILSSDAIVATAVWADALLNVSWWLVDRASWLISNLMYKILIYLCIIHLLKSSTCFFLNRCTGQSPAESDGTRGCI
jgi:hypothetical protein